MWTAASAEESVIVTSQAVAESQKYQHEQLAFQNESSLLASRSSLPVRALLGDPPVSAGHRRGSEAR